MTLTGSERPAASVARAAGKQIKKTVLELGGSDPFIVMPSADLDAAAATAVKARDDQQRPVVHRREAIHRSRADLRRVLRAVRRRHDGRSSSAIRWMSTTDVGPLATAQIRDDLRRAGDASRWRAARGVLARRQAARRQGLLLRADRARRRPRRTRRRFAKRPSARSRRSSARATSTTRSASRTIRASDSARAAWTRDEAESARFAARARGGQVFINGMVASDPRFPFGGVKRVRLRSRAGRVRHARVREHQDGAHAGRGVAPGSLTE